MGERSRREEFVYLTDRVLDALVPAESQGHEDVLTLRRYIDEYFNSRAATHDAEVRKVSRGELTHEQRRRQSRKTAATRAIRKTWYDWEVKG